MTTVTEMNKSLVAENLENIFKNINDNGTLSDDLKKELSVLRYESVEKPVIYIGAGTCGLGAGAGKTIKATKEYLAINNIDADIVEVGCIGLCAYEPMLDVQLPGKTRLSFTQVGEKQAAPILDAVFKNELPEKNVFGQFRSENLEAWEGVKYYDEIAFFKLQTRWVLANCGLIDPTQIDQYISRKGFSGLKKAVSTMTPIEVCDTVEQSGLRGRGGGGFPAGKKWKFAQGMKVKQKYLICNADEGDPGAFMDRAVIEGDPFRLLEGMAIAAYAIGASKAYIYIRAEYPLAIQRLKDAIEVAKAYGLVGKNILGSGFDLDFIIKKGAGAFVCGEETALINSIEGKRGMPKPRPPYPAVSGLFGKPTIINNVESFANVANIIRNGADWFSSIGTDNSKGTKVFALSGNITNTGLVEVAMGTSLREIIYEIGGGIPDGFKYKAVQIGGPSGGCIPEEKIDIDIDYESLKTVGAMMGSGGLVVMDENTCMVDVAKYFMGFIQSESCGKCIPCREGTRRMLEILERITSGKSNESELETLERFQSVLHMNDLAGIIQDASLCGLGKSAPNPVLSTLRWFRHEYEEHIYERKCRAKICKELLTFTIVEDKCTGCTLCARQCPADAIVGSKKHPHYINVEKCIGCGACVEVCNFDSINVD